MHASQGLLLQNGGKVTTYLSYYELLPQYFLQILRFLPFLYRLHLACGQKLHRLRFFFTHNQHVWDVLHFVITNLAADFLVTVIHQRADVVFLQFQTTWSAYSLNFSEIGRTATWSGVSHNGNLPAVCSIKTATKRSIEPNGAR